MTGRPTLAESLALAGGVAAAAGTVLPWVVTAPGVEVVPAVYLTGMGWGVAGFDLVVLAVLAVGLAAAGATRRRRAGAYVAAATGGAVVVGSVAFTLSSIGGFLGTFVPGPGLAVSVVGGLGLVVAAWRHAGDPFPDSSA